MSEQSVEQKAPMVEIGGRLVEEFLVLSIGVRIPISKLCAGYEIKKKLSRKAF